MTVITVPILAGASVELGRFAHRGASRQVHFDAAEGREPGANCGCQVLRRRGLVAERRPQDVADFRLSGPPVRSRLDAQPLLQRFVEVANDDAGDDRVSVSHVLSL